MDSALKHKKHVGFVFCNIGLFSVSLHRKRVFFQYAASQPDFHLILLKQRFCFLLAELRCLRIVFLRTALVSVSVTKLHFGRSILPKDVLACFCGIKLKGVRFCCQHTKTYFRYYETRQRVSRNEKQNRCFFVTKCSKHPISLPTRQNMCSIR